MNAHVDHSHMRAVRVNGRATLKHVFGRLDSVHDKGQVAERVNRHYIGYT